MIRVRLTPNSSSCLIKGVFIDANGAEYLKVFVISPPEKGKANKEALALLAKKLKISKSSLEIVSGETDRYKKFLIKNYSQEIFDALNGLMKECAEIV